MQLLKNIRFIFFNDKFVVSLILVFSVLLPSRVCLRTRIYSKLFYKNKLGERKSMGDYIFKNNKISQTEKSFRLIDVAKKKKSTTANYIVTLYKWEFTFCMSIIRTTVEVMNLPFMSPVFYSSLDIWHTKLGLFKRL